jgi:hypothetical protein
MTRILIFLTILCFILPLYSENDEPGLKIAVLTFISEEISDDIIKSVSDTVIDELNKDERFNAVKGSVENCFDSKCAIDAGKSLSAGKIVIGKIEKSEENGFKIYYEVYSINSKEKEFSDKSEVDSEKGILDAVKTITGKYIKEATGFPPLNIAASSEFTDKIEIKWEASPGSEKYYIYRSKNENGTFEEIGSIPETSFDDVKVLPGVKYFYRVKSWSESNKFSSFSKIANGYMKIKAPVLSLSTEGFSKIDLLWNNITGAVNYEILRADSPPDLYSKIGTSEKNVFSDTTIKSGKTYHYKVNAVSPSGLTEQSNTVSGLNEKTYMDYYLRSAVPGLGQYYTGRRIKGYIFGGSFALAGCLLGWSLYNQASSYIDYYNATSDIKSKWDNYNTATGIVRSMVSLVAIVYIANWADIIFFNTPESSKVSGKSSGLLNKENYKISYSLHQYRTRDDDITELSIILRF